MRARATYYALAPVYLESDIGLHYCLLRFSSCTTLKSFLERDTKRERVSWSDARRMFPILNRGSERAIWVEYPSKRTDAQYLATDTITETPCVAVKRS